MLSAPTVDEYKSKLEVGSNASRIRSVGRRMSNAVSNAARRASAAFVTTTSMRKRESVLRHLVSEDVVLEIPNDVLHSYALASNAVKDVLVKALVERESNREIDERSRLSFALPSALPSNALVSTQVSLGEVDVERAIPHSRSMKRSHTILRTARSSVDEISSHDGYQESFGVVPVLGDSGSEPTAQHPMENFISDMKAQYNLEPEDAKREFELSWGY